MSYSGSVFPRRADNNNKVDVDETDDFKKDGSRTMTGPLNMGGYAITNCPVITGFWDVVDSWYYYNGTDGWTAVEGEVITASVWSVVVQLDEVGDYCEYNFGSHGDGTYRIHVGIYPGTSAGIFNLSADGNVFAEGVDFYANTNVAAGATLISPAFAHTSGDLIFNATVTGKNAASSSYRYIGTSLQLEKLTTTLPTAP